jgi:transcriptional regulator with XRE-family HTH domain
MYKYDGSVGQKIKKYRARKGISQFKLETEIGASPGSISRIESGRINPTKETLLSVSNSLGLDDHQIADLFQVPFSTTEKTLKIVNEISESLDIEEIMQTAVNSIANQLQYITVCIFLLGEDRVLHAKYLNENSKTRLIIRAIGKSFNKLYVSEKLNKENLILKSALNKNIYEDDDLINFAKGAVPDSVTKYIQKISEVKRAIAIPLLLPNERSLGSVYFAKKEEKDYSKEIPILKSLASQIAININKARLVEEALKGKS